jgi:enoyl-CoA hydratase
MPEIDHGLVPSVATMLRAFNQYQAREIAFTGQRYSAEDMVRMGLLRSVEEPESLMPAARAVADVIAAKNPAAVRAAKFSANEVELMFRDFEAAHRAIESRV